MSAALQPTSLEDFLVRERLEELRCKFDGLTAVAMIGGAIERSVIGANLLRALEDRLGHRPCRAIGGNAKVVMQVMSAIPPWE